MSLRARLVATLLALSAAALLVLGAITYASQRSFEEQRIDDQARAAQPAVDRALIERGEAPGGRLRPPGEGARRGTGARRPGPEANLPPGTYGQRRDADGQRCSATSTLTYGQDALPSAGPAEPT